MTISHVDKKFDSSMQAAYARKKKNREESKRASEQLSSLLQDLPDSTETEDPLVEKDSNTESSITLRSTTLENEVANLVFDDESEELEKRIARMDTRMSTSRLVDVDQPKIERVPVEQVLNLKPVHCQRDTVLRYTKAKKHLNELCEEHTFISVVKATDDIEDEFGSVIYKKGEEFIVDGNTRVYHWNQETTKFIPREVYKITYEHDDIDDIADRYYRYDSKSALESAQDKVTGYYRENGMNLRTRKFSSGAIATALKYMYITTDKKLKDEERKKNAISMYKSEIELIDNIFADAEEYYSNNKDRDLGIVKPEPVGQQVICAMIMELKKYKENPEKRAEVINFIKGYLSSDFKASDRSAEAVLFNEFNGQYKDKGVLGKPSTKFSDIERQIGYAILCIEAYVSSSNHMISPPKSFDDDAGKELYKALVSDIKSGLRLA